MIPRSLLALVLPLAFVIGQEERASSGWPASSGWKGGGLETQSEVLRAHYAKVEAELRASTPAGLDDARRAARDRAIETLSAYRSRGDFGRGPEEGGGGRALAFVDAEGRRCAVAEILHVFGEDQLVERVAESANDAFVQELATNEALRAALDRIGLTVPEAARIQGPRFVVRNDTGPPPPPAPSGGDRPNRPERPAAPDSTGPTARPTPPTSPGATSPETPTRTLPELEPGTGAGEVAHWSTWWEFNKLAWLVRPADAVVEEHASDERTRSRSVREQLRTDVEPLVRAALSDGDPGVRRAAAVALARIAGEEAVEDLVALFDDANLDVRTDAILALGAADSEDAVHRLLRLAHTGAVTSQARTHATLALALARERGFGVGIERMLPLAEGRDLEQAVPLHASQAPSALLAAKLRALSGLYADGEPVRRVADANPRAIEALRTVEPSLVLEGLLRGSLSRDVEVRRSVAATLGRIEHPGALPPLMTAFEVESEPLARGFLLISIGRHGGETAREFLVDALRDGPKALRPWCALALGVAASEHGDELARAALRAAWPAERNVSARGAYLLAFGLSRDAGAEELLARELLGGANELTRGMAALGLGLSASPAAGRLLRESLQRDHSPATRTTILQALACLRAPEDVVRLVEAVREVRMPEEQVQLAAALAFHGSLASAPLLAEVAERDDSAPVAKAAALQALGMLLDDVAPFRFAALSRDANYATFLEWINAPLQSTL